MATTPQTGLSSLFSSLGTAMASPTPFGSTPAVPNVPTNTATPYNANVVPTSSAPQVGPSSAASLGLKPVVPNIPSSTPGGLNYQIQPGDSLGAIASKYGTTVSALMAANPNITNANLIQAGASLNIPGGGSGAGPVVPTNTSTSFNQNTAPLSTPNVTTSSGTTVNPNTGAVVASPAPVVPSTTVTGSGGTVGTTPTTPTVPSTVYGSSTAGLQALGATNPATQGAGVAGYDTAVENLANFEAAQQAQLGNIAKQPIPLPFAQGQEQVTNTENAGILSALQGAVTSSQQGVSLGIQGQQTEQNALQEAGSLTQPVAGAAFFGTPETGAIEGAGNASMASAVALQAQKLQNGTTDPASAEAALSAYGQAGMDALQTALGPNFNLPAAAGSAAATESNTTLAGTATPTAENTIYQQALGDQATLTQAVNNVAGLGSTLTGGMTAANGETINPSDVQYANMTLAQFRQQLSSPSQAQFDTTLAALQTRVGSMLSIGGTATPTQLTADANSIINGTAPIGTIQATLDRIQTEGNILLTNQASKVNTAKANITPPSGTNLGTGGSTSGVFSDANFFGS